NAECTFENLAAERLGSVAEPPRRNSETRKTRGRRLRQLQPLVRPSSLHHTPPATFPPEQPILHVRLTPDISAYGIWFGEVELNLAWLLEFPEHPRRARTRTYPVKRVEEPPTAEELQRDAELLLEPLDSGCELVRPSCAE